MIHPARRGFPIILSAPSGAGKTTLSREVIKIHPEIFYSISMTSRTPRAGERDGLDYHFVSGADFEGLLERQELIEWAVVHDNYYGTPKIPFEQALERGQDVIMDIDTVGARSIMQLYPRAVTIFVLPPSLEVLKQRLRGRATDTEEVINKRLTRAKLELAQIGDYQYWLVNDRIEAAVRDVASIIEAERCRLDRYDRSVFTNLKQ